MKKKSKVAKEDLLKMVNPKKLNILEVIHKEKELNQSNIKDITGISYRQTRRYLDSLHEIGLIKKKQSKKKVGNPVNISLKK